MLNLSDSNINLFNEKIIEYFYFLEKIINDVIMLKIKLKNILVKLD